MVSKYEQEALYEHRFWLQVLGDHSRFIYNALSPKETEEIETAYSFIRKFDQLLQQAMEDLSPSQLTMLNQRAALHAKEIRRFKLHLIQRHLVGEISISLPPTFLNHMVNEVEEYLRILSALLKNEVPPSYNPVHYHLLWLSDASGHASSITSGLDMVEKGLICKSSAFSEHFNDLYLKAVEVAGYMRTRMSEFPALFRLNKEAELETLLFTEFLKELEEMEISHSLLGTLSPLLFDHMAREECYYLTKLAQVSEVNQPECNAVKPRIE